MCAGEAVGEARVAGGRGGVEVGGVGAGREAAVLVEGAGGAGGAVDGGGAVCAGVEAGLAGRTH